MNKTFPFPLDLSEQGIGFRPAEETDIPFLLALRYETMGPHVVASGVTHSEQDYLDRVLVSFELAWILLREGQPAGLLKVSREGQVWELKQIQLGPVLQGQGLGQRIIEAFLAEARRCGARVKLDVFKANPARKLYERLGFVVVGEHGALYEMECPAPGM